MYKLPTNRWIFVVLSLVMPLWITFGRIPFGATGWLTLILLLDSPVVIILLLALSLTYFFRPDVRKTHHVTQSDARSLWVLMVSLLLVGLFLIDFGDTEDSVRSAFTAVVGRGFNGVSAVLEIIFMVVAAAAFVWSIVQLVRSYRHMPAKVASE